MTILICFSFVFTLSGQVEENIFRCRSEIKYYHPIDLSKTGELNQIFELSNFQDHSPLYSYIEIYLDSEGNKTIEEIRKNDEIWQVNRTAREFFSNKVYWVKIEFESKKQREGLIINLSPNDWDQSWNTIDSWTLLEDSIINYNRTGWNISNHEKPVASPLNLIELPQVEGDQINLILRLEGIPEGKNRIPELINFWVLNSKNYPGLTSGYHLPGKFVSSESTNFTHSPIINTELWIDPVGDATIDVVEYSWNSHKTSDIFQTPHLPNTVYWMKTSFIGNETFFGEQMLHISSRPRWGGLDFFSFDHVDAYYIHKSGKRIHQTSGDHVALTQRPYNHWPNFLRLDIALNDTIDLYIRMEGADRRFLMSHICLYQIEKSSVYPDQLGLARSEGFFYGVLIIQILFFSVLYLIGKERTHGCFTLVAIGLFLVLGFSEDNFHVFVNFPTLRDYHVPLFFIGTFILSTGIISFAKEYFRIIMSTVWRKTLYLFLISCAFINCYAIYKFEYTLEFGNPATQLYVQLAIIFVMLSIVIGLCIAIFSVQRKGVSKKLYLLAFLPISIVGIIHWVRVLGMYMWGLELSIDHLVGISNINLIRIAIVSMLTLFALSIGSRINRLKEEKKMALQLAEKNVIIEAKSKQNEFLVKEIHHRVKNNLQILSSLLSLQSDHLQDKNAKSVLQEGRNRVESMGLIHQRLYGNEEAMSVNMKRYGADLCRYLEASFSTLEKEIIIEENIQFETMDVDYAIPLGLIINELVTNSVKYAFQERNKGRIFVALWEEEEKLILRVADNGQGYVAHSSRNSTSFGSELIKTLSKKLKGTIAQIIENGFETKITFLRYK